MSKSGSPRGVFIAITILIIAAGAAFMVMRDTLDNGAGPSGDSSASAPGQPGTTQPRPGNQAASGQTSQSSPQAGMADNGRTLPETELPAPPDQPGNGSLPPGQPAGRILEQPQLPGQPQVQIPGQAPGQAPGQTPGQAPGQTPGQAPGQTPGQEAALPDQIPEQIPGQTPDQIPGRTPEQIAGQADPLPPGRDPLDPFGMGMTGGPESIPAPAVAAGGGAGDSMLLPSFVDDLTRLMVAGYWPRGTHPSATSAGISTFGIRSANMRYGSRPNGIRWGSGDPFAARQAALQSIFTPARLDSLYSLYIDRFIASLARNANTYKNISPAVKRDLSAAEVREMFRIYAARARGLAATLNAYTEDPGVRGKVEKLAVAQSAVHAANRDLLDSRAGFEVAREEKRPDLAEARALMDQDSATYQQRIREREEASRALAESLGRGLDEDSRIYCAFWAYRRGPQAIPSLKAAAGILVNTANRLGEAAR